MIYNENHPILVNVTVNTTMVARYPYISTSECRNNGVDVLDYVRSSKYIHTV